MKEMLIPLQIRRIIEKYKNITKIVKLSDLGKFYKGKGIANCDIKNSGLPCITYGQLYTEFNGTIKDVSTYINSNTAKNSVLIHKNDILFPSSGETIEEIGKASVNLVDEPLYAGGDIIVFTPNIDVNSRYLTFLLNSDVYRAQARRFGQGHSVVHIYTEPLGEIILPILPFEEQKLIADILSTWDHAIELRRELSNFYKMQYKFLLNSLTKNVFSRDSDWDKIKLKKIMKEESIKSTQNNEYEILSSTKNDIYKQSEYFNRQVASKSNIGYKILNKKRIVMSPQNAWMGNVNYNDKYEVGLVSPSYKIFKLLNVSEDYFKHLIKSHRFIHHIDSYSEQGASIVRKNLSIDEFLNSYISLPNIEMQKKYGHILDLIDIKIKKNEELLDFLKNQKKGLMQRLLTGQVRVQV